MSRGVSRSDLNGRRVQAWTQLDGTPHLRRVTAGATVVELLLMRDAHELVLGVRDHAFG